MIRYVGLDVHKRSIAVCIVAAGGQVLARFSIAGTRVALESFAKQHLLATDEVALEATTHCWAVARVLKPFVARAVVSNPLQTKAIAQAKIKTDKVDALALAQLLRTDFLPLVWEPDETTEQRRVLCSRRAGLVAERTRLKNRIHATLAHGLIAVPEGDLFSKQGQAWLAQQELPPRARTLIDSDRRLLAACEAELEALDRTLVQEAYAEPRVRLLMTLPGVDYTVALALVAVLGDVHRFTDGDHAAAYLGLVPSTYQSGEHCYHGPITKQGNRRARWLLIQAAQHVAAHPGPLGVFFRRLLKKKNRNVAVVATARKLVVIAWHMLQANEPYRYAQPAATEAKLARLRVKATGQRRKTGPAKGSAPAAHQGTGQRRRRVPSLPEVYAAEGLPAATAPTGLPAGEARALTAAGVSDYVEQIQQPRHRERPARGAGTPAGSAPASKVTSQNEEEADGTTAAVRERGGAAAGLPGAAGSGNGAGGSTSAGEAAPPAGAAAGSRLASGGGGGPDGAGRTRDQRRDGARAAHRPLRSVRKHECHAGELAGDPAGTALQTPLTQSKKGG
jgi:transposase